MKIVVIGGSGRIGERLVRNLRQEDCRVFEASPSYGVDAVTGQGLAEALAEAEIVVDVSNSPSLEGPAALRFFEAAGRNLAAVGRAAGVRHHIALSIVGVDRLLAGEYFRAKQLQEDIVRGSGIPFTILRSTQFFEFISDVVQEGTARDIPISPALAQPIAGEDVADMLADVVFSDPFNAAIEIAGPEQFRLDQIATEIATAHEDGRRVVADVHARYFGLELEERSLLPGPDARIAAQRFDDWLRDSLQPAGRAAARAG
ncbi:NAD(P)H-binding protein [Sphingomonas sp. DG1-23]|uniref:SDR family oxidoreductase n=1 Tax=Sphingomonas sp. DG1-23 TaxID=3068316 RepID=UPI00273D8BB3|nr:NAD(P)H-binding protein [Sphingomonas sp. DG1-23]MDP5277457.1 NAD(P)H-binding protein [Sphingomonas sp. DG1-23]